MVDLQMISRWSIWGSLFAGFKIKGPKVIAGQRSTMINNKLLDLMTLWYLQTPLQRWWRPPPSFHRQESLSEPSGSSIKRKQGRAQSGASCTPWYQEGVAWDSGNGHWGLGVPPLPLPLLLLLLLLLPLLLLFLVPLLLLPLLSYYS